MPPPDPWRPGSRAPRRWLWLLVLGLGLAGPVVAAGGPLLPLGEAPPSRLNPLTPAKIALGTMLFFDRRLSGDGTMSCASCHIPELAFADGQAISLSYPTTANWRNAPTLINIAFARFLFHDGRSASLEDQALFPIMSSFEMNQNLDFLEEELRSVPEYRQAFAEVFGSEDTSRDRVGLALAAFQRTLVSRGAPIDRFLAGDQEALSREAQSGLAVFTGKGRCTDCHFGPTLADDRFHALHVPENPIQDARVAATRRFVAKVSRYEGYRDLTEDPGRYLVSRNDEDWRAFRTPTLREIARTGPYMHNGSFATLEEVITFFDQGGGPGNRKLVPLFLSAVEKRAVAVFLREALTGEEIVVRPPSIP
ncbi:MAG: cytochrome c peroxidase [Thermodesulfobacteriota bacterium]